jgi:hypothetical protein
MFVLSRQLWKETENLSYVDQMAQNVVQRVFCEGLTQKCCS